MAAYRLEVNWLVAGSSSVQDLVQTLYKKAYKLGLRLAQARKRQLRACRPPTQRRDATLRARGTCW
jgi:hypothetical protein